jgi:hypothetical protein
MHSLTAGYALLSGSLLANAVAALESYNARKNAPNFAPKTTKCRPKSTRFEPLFNVLVQPQTDIPAKYLRPRIHFSPENHFLPHSVGMEPDKIPSIVGL